MLWSTWRDPSLIETLKRMGVVVDPVVTALTREKWSQSDGPDADDPPSRFGRQAAASPRRDFGGAEGENSPVERSCQILKRRQR
jgi:hypothetical protein